jgi:DNA-binding CsgD family transcriptional regulator
LHAQALRGLLTREADPSQAARLVHHAKGAHDESLIARYAPLAARHAAAQGAHREAAAQYATALAHAEALPAEERAALLEAQAEECYLLGQMQGAEAARQAALQIWRQTEHANKVGHTLRWLSRLAWTLGQRTAAEAYATEAVHVLEALPTGAELAMAYSNRAQLAMNVDDHAEAIWWGEKAIALAEQVRDVPTMVHALTTVGTARLARQDEQGWVLLEQSLRLALEQELEEHAARAYTNLSCCAIGARDYLRARSFLEDGLAYCAERDLDFWGAYLRAYRAQARFEQGAWDEAAEEATQVLSQDPPSTARNFLMALVLGWVRLRRGLPGSEPLLEEARRLALVPGDLQRVASVAAEAAWLQGDLERCQAEARVGYDLALAQGDPWALGQLSSWLRHAGSLTSAPQPIAEPFARLLACDWQGAAAWWAEVGCPYEQALALAQGDVGAQQQALALFAQLGAQPAAARLRQRMRQQGRVGIPRGPRPATRANPAGLTSREVEVLLLLAEGLSNAQIASRLSTSVRTVVHQVSAIFAKLQVHSRLQASTAAATLGLHPPQHGTPPRAR